MGDDTWSKEQGPLTELGKFVQCFMSSDEAISIATDKVEDASWIRAVLNDCARQQKVRADQIIAIEKCVGMYGKTGDDVKYFQLTDMPKESLELYKKTQTRQKAIVEPLMYSKDRFDYIPYVAIDDDLPYEQFYAHTPDAALDIVCSRASDNKPKAFAKNTNSLKTLISVLFTTVWRDAVSSKSPLKMVLSIASGPVMHAQRIRQEEI